MGNLKKLALMAGGLYLWYSFCAGIPKKSGKDYPLPEEIRVVESSAPVERMRVSVEKEGVSVDHLEKIVKTSDIDFSKDFYIKTDRYTIHKRDDMLPSRIIGFAGSLPSRLYFCDWDISDGPDAKRARAALSILEENKDIHNLTVRLDHNRAWYDLGRLFTDKKVAERNPILARAVLGVPASLSHELWAEFSRGDYYNPFTQTVVAYSNVESIIAHEIGHHEDFSRFGSDWAYTLTNVFPPAILYKEWNASKNATGLLAPEDRWQLLRYLAPAFATYIIGVYALGKNSLKQERMRRFKEPNPQIRPIESCRRFVEMNTGLFAALMFYDTARQMGTSDSVHYIALGIGTIAGAAAARAVLGRIIPYTHDVAQYRLDNRRGNIREKVCDKKGYLPKHTR